MKFLIKLIVVLFFAIMFFANANANEEHFIKAKQLFKYEKYEDSKFLFQRSIVFDPKHTESYLYLAKIFKIEKDEEKEIKNLNTVLLLESDNEEATYLLIEIELNRSNFSKVKELRNNLELICSKLCDNITSINEKLNDIEAKNES